VILYYATKDGSYRHVVHVDQFFEALNTNEVVTKDLHPLHHDTYAFFKKELLTFNDDEKQWQPFLKKYISMYDTYRLNNVSENSVIKFLKSKECILLGVEDE